MGKSETWVTGLLLLGAALLLPIAALAPVSLASARAVASACDDGSAHLAMGCASIAL